MRFICCLLLLCLALAVPSQQVRAQSEFLQASNGTDVSKVSLFWSLPSLVSGASELRVHRSLQPLACSGLLQGGLAASATSFDDTFSVIPGTAYFYSIEAVAPGGTSLGCSEFDSGYARVSPPIAISATDGTFPDKVVVNWQAPPLGGNITGYSLYRGTACSTLLQSGISPSIFSYQDFSAVPGTVYQYSLKTNSPTGQSDCSAIDPGFARTICTNGLDDDGDGLADYPEDPGCLSLSDNDERQQGHICDDGLDNDEDGKVDFRPDGTGDPACESPNGNTEIDGEAALSSPAFAKFNTYLGQWNFAEIVNQGAIGKVVDVTVHNLRGQVMIQRSFFVPAGNQVDVDINALVQFACDVLGSNCDGFEDLSKTVGAPNGLGVPDGIVDTYGLVRFDWDDSNANDRIFGRISFYRPNIDGSFSFAFAREFRNRLNGTSYAMSNTFDPNGGDDLTPNWIEIINFGSKGVNGPIFDTQSYQVRIFNQDGLLVETKNLTLPPLAEFDIQGGHEYLDSSGRVRQAVYLVEVIPANPQAEYFFSIARYNSNAPRNVDAEDYNFALVLDGREGSMDPLYAPISNTLEGVIGMSVLPGVDNWVETACVAGNEPCQVNVKFKDRFGAVIASTSQYIAAHAQFHFNAGAILPFKDSGSLEISSNKAVIAQSMSYLQGAKGGLLSGFASLAKNRQRANQIGTMNTFLGMQNQLSLISTSSSPVSADYLVKTFGGESSSGVLNLSNGAASLLSLSNNPGILFPKDRYGTIGITTTTEGQAVAEVRRVRLFSGEVDYVMPTLVR